MFVSEEATGCSGAIPSLFAVVLFRTEPLPLLLSPHTLHLRGGRSSSHTPSPRPFISVCVGLLCLTSPLSCEFCALIWLSCSLSLDLFVAPRVTCLCLVLVAVQLAFGYFCCLLLCPFLIYVIYGGRVRSPLLGCVSHSLGASVCPCLSLSVAFVQWAKALGVCVCVGGGRGGVLRTT